ncbi:MAG: NAD-dependent epimerase/dehydratase family protein [Pseudonocardiaceae bacterium]
MTWLLTGGAGYIGSHIAYALRATGRDVVVLDDLSTGYPHRLPPAAPLIQASVLDRKAVVQALLRLLDAMRLVFSSSAAVYGDTATEIIDETTPTRPASPYSATKLIGERVVRRAGLDTGMGWPALRYFNVTGAGALHLGDAGVANLIPHVADVTDAHVTAAQHLE